MRSLLAVGLFASIVVAEPITIYFDVEGSPILRTYTEGGMTITNPAPCLDWWLEEEPGVFFPSCHVRVGGGGGGGLAVAGYIIPASVALRFDMGGQTFNLISVDVVTSWVGSHFTTSQNMDIIPPDGALFTSYTQTFDYNPPLTHYFNDPSWSGITELYWWPSGWTTITSMTFEPVGSVPEPAVFILFGLGSLFLIGGISAKSGRKKIP